MNTIETWTTTDGYQVSVRYDDSDYCDPRDWDNLGTMVCWHGRYNLGDEQPKISPSEYLEDLPDGTITLPLYLYDHGGITMSTGPFSCPWDSGQVGFIYVTRETLAKEFPTDMPDDDKVREYLTGEVKIYDTYLRGEIYRYEVERGVVCSHGGTHWEHVDSCGGYYGDYGLDEIKSTWPEVVTA
jgi:hypothetical protein